MSSELLIDAHDVQVVLFRMPGTWRWNGTPRALGGGEYEVTFAPPAPGQYKLVVGIDSWAAPMGSLPPFTLGVEEPKVAGGKPARAEGNR